MADNSTTLGQNFAKLPSGTTAERPASPAIGYMRYNTTIGYMEYYGAGGWTAIAAPPNITTVSPSTYNGESGTIFTITGSFFDSGATVKFITAQNTEFTAAAVTYVNQSQLYASTPQDFTVANEPLSIKVINGSGLSYTLSSAIDCGGAPAWNTAAGSLGTYYDNTSVSTGVSATDPDAGATITYSIISGNIPSGLSFNTSTGAITGTTSVLSSSTTSNFTVRATDNAGNTSERAFSISVIATNYFGSGADGAGSY